MAGHVDLPKATPPLLLRKGDIFDGLKRVDEDARARARVLRMESEFRSKIGTHIKGLPGPKSRFAKFYTSPFVLMFYSYQKSYSRVGEIEQDIVPAKVFSSMETSAGSMIEKVVLPIYGWEVIQSAMHSHGSLLDGRRIERNDSTFIGATLKSGPRTLNDDMVSNIAKDLVEHAPSWALSYGVREVEFTYGALYGTKRQSNKKDWHILRNIEERRPPKSTVTASHEGAWSIGYKNGPLQVSATVRIGLEWWEYLGGRDAWIELCCALIRACINPSNETDPAANYTIVDMPAILDVSMLPHDYNVSILQNSQFEWLLFLARHFADGFAPD